MGISRRELLCVGLAAGAIGVPATASESDKRISFIILPRHDEGVSKRALAAIHELLECGYRISSAFQSNLGGDIHFNESVPGYRKVLYDVKCGDRGQVFDANGSRLDWVTQCNIETGEVRQIVMGPDGLPVQDGYDIATKVRFYPAPLRWEGITP